MITPYPAWVGSSTANYDAPDRNYGASYDGGAYTLDYTTTFDLPDRYDPSSVMITGDWSTDNYGLDILVNGNSTGSLAPDFVSYYPFTLSGATGFFVNGVNTIDFQWQNVRRPRRDFCRLPRGECKYSRTCHLRADRTWAGSYRAVWT